MLVHQAVYGDRGGAHVLLTSSPAPEVPFAQLVTRTDLPASPLPRNLVWKPYICGFAFGDWYILSRTFPDPQASRSGMVRTYVLAMPLDEGTELSDLTPVLNQLPDSLDDIIAVGGSQLPSLEVGGAVFRDDEHKEAFLESTGVPGLAKVASVLVSTSGPVIWIGEEGLSDIVVQLWSKLWPSARKKLSFRTSFGIQEVERQEWTLVATPNTLESLWREYPKVRMGDVHIPQNKAEGLLLGQSTGEPLRTLLRELGNPPIEIRQLRYLERVYDLLDKLPQLSAAEARELFSLVANLAPDPLKGREIKSRILSTLSDVTSLGTAADIKGLRLVGTEAFAGARTAISTAIENWFTRLLTAGSPAIARESLEIVQLGFTETAIESEQIWKNSIVTSVSAAVKKWGRQIPRIVWLWWRQDDLLVKKLEKILPTGKQIETDLVEHSPRQLTQRLGLAVCAMAIRRRWYKLHGAAVAAFVDVPIAIDSQLALGGDKTLQLDGLRVLAERLPAGRIVQAALSKGDEVLYYVAGELCAQQPKLLSKIDVREHSWRRLWLRAIEAGAEPFAGLESPQSVMYSLADLLLKNVPIDTALLYAVSETPYADLVAYHKRAAVWAVLEPNTAKHFLERTAQGWLEQFRREPNFDDKLESELERHVLAEDMISTYLEPGQPGAIRAGINLFLRFRALREDRFRRWLTSLRLSGSAMDPWDAKSLGKLVSDRRWSSAADDIANGLYIYNRRDFEPALQECLDLLGWLKRIQIALSGKLHGAAITENDWWNALEEVLVDLYPHGPGDRSIWERAGGDASELRTGSTGKERWKSTIHFLRNGGGKNVNGNSLLQEIRREYWGNDKLRQLDEALRRFLSAK
jgi:hypothetical protein